MARSLASRIGYRYIDSGAMYRAVTLYGLNHGYIKKNGTIDVIHLIKELPSINIDFKVMDDGKQHTMLNGIDVETEIRGMEVANHVSHVATIPEVRHRLVDLQQEFGRQKGIVMDGRDIGTTVFPDAELKVYVNAPAETRAQRRYDELRAKGDATTTYQQVLENVKSRDYQDMHRAESPLRKAPDAIELDNSNMTLAQQDAWLIRQVNNTTSLNK